MRTLRLQNLMAIVLVCGLTFTSTNLFAQGAPTAHVPIGPPVPVASQYLSLPSGLVPAIGPQLPTGGGVPIVQSYDGIDFLGSNCGCLPPDTNAAVGNNYVVETVNVQLRVFDKATGTVLLDEPLSTLFGAASGGDPYVVYDDIASRWYVSAFDSTDAGLFLAVSTDANPLDGFQTFDLTAVGGFPDYQKMGFNKDAIFISFNDFGSTAAATIASIACSTKSACSIKTRTCSSRS